jgi:transcriptional regulator GlxA family with amidase domain
VTARDPIPDYVHLLRAKDRIDGAYGEPLDVPALARTALASPKHFIRTFRAAFGETPHQYLLRRRVERAKELLRATDASVTEISLEVGFRSLGSFSTAFRSFAGEPPSRYRTAWRACAQPAIPACHTLMWSRPTERALSEKRPEPSGDSVAA